MNKRAVTYYQQGDVIIEPAQMPSGKASRSKKLTLAHGEHTGHSHQLVVEQPYTIEAIERGGVLYLRTSGPSVVEHEEHKPVKLPPGDYRVRRVQEYDHFAEEARNVQD